MNRLEGQLDGMLHLMDRQVIDSEGRMVCKVDGVEVTEWGDGTLAVTGLLVGPAALVPRLGGSLGRRFGEFWRRLGLEHADRTTPYRIDLERVAELGSDVRLDVRRDGLLTLQGPAEPGTKRRRLEELLGADVRDSEGTHLGHVLDVRLERPGRDPGQRLHLSGLIVGRGHPGSLLGYDRRPDQGPALLRLLIRRLHRSTGLVGLDDVAHLDWEQPRVVVRRGLAPLGPAEPDRR